MCTGVIYKGGYKNRRKKGGYKIQGRFPMTNLYIIYRKAFIKIINIDKLSLTNNCLFNSITALSQQRLNYIYDDTQAKILQ